MTHLMQKEAVQLVLVPIDTPHNPDALSLVLSTNSKKNYTYKGAKQKLRSFA